MRLKSLFCLLLAAACAAAVSGCTARKASPPALSPCLNIGNSLEAPKGQSWGVPMRSDYFALIRSAGFACVRLPVRFSDYAGDKASGYRLDESFMKQLDGYVHTAEKQHLTLILDMHHFLPMMSDPQGHADELIALWRQIAQRYRREPSTLVYELLNEPQGNLESAGWNRILAKLDKAVRKIDRTHYLIVGGADYNSVDGLQQLTLPADSRLIATIHYYEPNDVTFQGDAYADANGKNYGNVHNVSWTGTTEEQAYLASRLEKAKQWADRQHVPLFIGEFGVSREAPAATRTAWTAAVAGEAKHLGIGYAYWEFASGFGIYDLSTGQWNRDMLRAILTPDAS